MCLIVYYYIIRFNRQIIISKLVFIDGYIFNRSLSERDETCTYKRIVIIVHCSSRTPIGVRHEQKGDRTVAQKRGDRRERPVRARL